MLPASKKYPLILVAIILNGLASFLITLKHQPISVDGILYLNAAQAYLTSGFSAAAKIYPWPFYSVLLGLCNKCTHLSLLQSGIFLTIIFSTFIVIYFILLIECLGGGKSEKYWGLLVILLCPFLNHERINILRDMGYYAFLLISLFYLIKFIQQNKLQQGVTWQMSLIAASLFRIEGVFVYLLTPIFIKKNRIKLYCIGLLCLIIAAVFYQSFAHFGRIPELLKYLNTSSIAEIFQQKVILQKTVLGIIGQDNAPEFVVGGLISLFVFTFIHCLGIVYLILFLYFAWQYKKFKINTDSVASIRIYIAIITVVLAVFTVRQFFLTERYIFPLVILFMLFLPFALTQLWQEKLIYKILLILCFSINAVSSFGQFGTSKTYIIDAGDWISNNTPTNAMLYTNDALIGYYAHRAGTKYPDDFQHPHDQNTFLTQSQSNYNYAALLIKHNETLVQYNQLSLLKVFTNNKHDKIYIYKTYPPNNTGMK